MMILNPTANPTWKTISTILQFANFFSSLVSYCIILTKQNKQNLQIIISQQQKKKKA